MFSTLHSIIFLWITNANTKLRIKLANYHNINIDINPDLMHFNFSVRLILELCCQSQFCLLYQGSKTDRSPEFMHPALSTKWLLLLSVKKFIIRSLNIDRYQWSHIFSPYRHAYVTEFETPPCTRCKCRPYLEKRRSKLVVATQL